ncbi:hypothetical protein LCGC14_1658440, partial [marine sediment metagenome]
TEYGGHYGAHIVLETKIDEQWIVLDPLYDFYFINPDGTLASFADVRNDWDYFKSQTPPEYPREMYKYLGVRYTNWEKIPFITPALRLTLKILTGEDKVQKLSLRVYLIDTYRVYIVALLILYIPIIAITFVTVRNRLSVRSTKQGSNSE